MTQSKTLCVNGKQYFHRFKQEEISAPLDLLAYLEKQKGAPKFYWNGRNGIEVAAWGSALTLNEVPLFGRANDSPARFWGGHAFFPSNPLKSKAWATFPTAAFFLPQYELVRKKNKLELITHAINAPLPEEPSFASVDFLEEVAKLGEGEHLPSSKKWKRLVSAALNAIEENSFEKVVMARRSTYYCSVNPYALLAKNKGVEATRFAIQFGEGATFIGVTPELLYQRKGTHLVSEAVAGTRKRGSSEEEDATLEQELLENSKERREFLFVKGSIEQGLRPLCSSFSWKNKDCIVKTPTVQHLHNVIEASLQDGVDDEQILKSLHPTAAMGGSPQKSALEHLINHEPFERGWYASPIGYVGQEEAEFAVAIRSVLVEKEALHLFTGAGIVEGSEPEKEWEELEHKSSLWVKG